jgi:hypothetical protein
VRVYPTFQFTSDGRIVSGLPHVLSAFGAEIDSWMLASWLVSPVDELGGSPLDALFSEVSLDQVIVLARETGARWSR